jgi:predicted adenine nucleotide alpha hydrolase (AANH) superfamily ATPase
MVESEKQNERPELLLHICCAPCSTYPIEVLKSEYRLIGLYYGPNIHPEVEYIVRLEEMERLAKMTRIELIRAEYDMTEWFHQTEGMEEDHEGGERCRVCYRMRLGKTAQYAIEKKIEYFTTTLSVSPHKNAEDINEIGIEVAEQFGLTFLPVDFKKKDGHKKSIEISKKLGLYRQDYCGCVYSRRERDYKLRLK